MSFLDSLENNLKAAEERGQIVEQDERASRQRSETRARELAAAPWAERLKNGPYTAELLRQVTRIGHGMRTKVYIAWLDDSLRLNARERRLELNPTPEGIDVVFCENGTEVRRMRIDLSGNPEELAREWLGAS